MSEESIECWHCNMPVTLAERGDNDGFCPHCMCELDLDDYLCQSLATINQLRAELAAIKAQEPVFMWHKGATEEESEVVDVDCACPCCVPLYAAPVSEAKAQGVVMPERRREAETDDEFSAWVRGWNACLDEVARLNSAPVQQVSVPDGKVCVPVEVLRLYEFMAASFTPFTSQHEQIAISLRKAKAAMLYAAPAAPAADGGMVDALDYQVLFDAIAEATSVYANGAVNISVRAFRDALAAHRAKEVV